MPDKVYCYPNSDVLINKLNIRNNRTLFNAEVELTSIRLEELQKKPLVGKFDFKHLKAIHKYIFQDLYEWAGKERTVDIGKGNLFCTVPCIHSYAETIFKKYYPQCHAVKDNLADFVRIFAENYGDLNALHPFREGNGRTQREFARLICLECGFDFDLSCTTHEEMLSASIMSFNTGDNSGFVKIFSQAVTPHKKTISHNNQLMILTSNDLDIESSGDYDYYGYGEHKDIGVYNEIYKAKIQKMDAEATISNANDYLKNNTD